uniref:(California timema) hypothetical protein n=1 Tax=Timema californicum TaxID=61474 RepID=A0A7R9JKG6_TIMCA|nr:unnamed protein product [Timema californicum]
MGMDQSCRGVGAGLVSSSLYFFGQFVDNWLRAVALNAVHNAPVQKLRYELEDEEEDNLI